MGFLRTVVQKHAFNVVQTKAYIHGARLLRTRLAGRQSEDCLYLNIRTTSPLVLAQANRLPHAAPRGVREADENDSLSEGEGETDSSAGTSDEGLGDSDEEGAEPGLASLSPVIVYFHGGDYHDGAGGSRPFYAANALPVRGRVVLVTFNYRLGLMGHFTHPELSKEADVEGRGKVSGNYGILDQVQVLGAQSCHFPAP